MELVNIGVMTEDEVEIKGVFEVKVDEFVGID